MRTLLCATLILLPLPRHSHAEDANPPIRIQIKPLAEDSAGPLPSPAGFNPTPLHNPVSEVPSLSLSMLRVYPLPDSMDAQQKAIAGFPEFWARVEKENGIDALRRQLGMPMSGGTAANWKAPLAVSGDGLLSLDFLSLGSSVLDAWRTHAEADKKEARFQSQVQSLMELTRELSERKGGSPAISLIQAKLDFMGKRVKGELPKVYDRRIFTENLKAWAVNPLFDSTGLGPRLAELCRIYEEYGK